MDNNRDRDILKTGSWTQGSHDPECGREYRSPRVLVPFEVVEATTFGDAGDVVVVGGVGVVGVGGVAKGKLIAVSAKDVEYVRVSSFLRTILGCLSVLYDDIIESKKAVRNDDSNDKKK